jgi:D-alanyl-D-alanine carboxypeptidase
MSNHGPKFSLKFSIILLLAIAFSARAQTAAPKESAAALREKLQAKLDELHRGGKFPGATLGVALADGQSFGLATGFSDREAKTRMRPSDLMLQGSVGKTYAAALAMQLIKEGRINLDDKIEKHLGREPWFARLPNSKEITVRMLMNHTSGLVRYEFKEEFAKDLTADVDKVWRPDELIAYILDTKAPFEAGKGWDYSDTNYIVLGMIIEKVTGKRYYDLVGERILRPLKLKQTVPSDSRRIRGLAQGYAGEGNPFGGVDAMIVNGKFAINPQFEWTGGGMASTTEDLARWAKAMYEGRAFDAALLPEMLEGTPSPMLGREAKYGLGVIIRPTALGTSYGHTGFFPGYVTEMIYFPEHKIALALQINSSVPRAAGKPLVRFLVEAAEILLGRSSHQSRPAITP